MKVEMMKVEMIVVMMQHEMTGLNSTPQQVIHFRVQSITKFRYWFFSVTQL